MVKAIIIGLVLTVCALFVFTKIDPNVNVNGPADSTIVEGNYLTVSISGEVNKAGTYVMKDEDTLGDLIEAAGGITSNADNKSFNSSILLKDGMSYYISPLALGGDACVIEKVTKVNINVATKEELMSINGIGATVAGAIIDYRDQNGPFTYLEQIMEVPGIGNATFEKIKNYITIS